MSALAPNVTVSILKALQSLFLCHFIPKNIVEMYFDVSVDLYFLNLWSDKNKNSKSTLEEPLTPMSTKSTQF